MMRMLRAVLPLLGLIACLTAAPARGADAADWPKFRGPTGQGLTDAKGLPVEWSPTKNVAWQAAVPGRGWSSPVLSAGKIYLTTGVGNGALSLRAVCLDAATGQILWNTEVVPAAGATQQHKKNSPASATPIVTADRLFVHFGPMGTAALDLTGKVLWKQTSLTFPPVHGNGGSPVLVDGLLVFSCDGARDPYLAALDAASGDVKWKTPRNTKAKATFSFSTPYVLELDGKSQVVSPTSGFVGGYDPSTGKELWRVGYGEGYSVVPCPAFAHGMLFVSSGFDRPVAYAIKPQGASGDVTKTHVAWTHAKGVPATPSMVVLGDEIYFVSDAGVATCADAKTGKVRWTERLGGNFSASPIAGDGKVYFQNEEGVGYVVKAGTKYESLGENDLGERSLASYAVGNDGSLLIRTEKHLWKVAMAHN
jgi:outer membrane protein assembly factor BamB